MAGGACGAAQTTLPTAMTLPATTLPTGPMVVATSSAEMSPTPPPSSARSDPLAAAGIAATSQRYRYSLRYPSSWTFAEPPGAGGVHPNEPGVDTYVDPVGRILSIVGESAAPTLSGWTCAIGRHLQREHSLAVEAIEPLTVAGEPARLSSYHLVITPYVIHYLTVELVRDGQGLVLSLESTTGRDGEDRATLDRVLATLRLGP
jgi:hypothetical protein